MSENDSDHGPAEPAEPPEGVDQLQESELDSITGGAVSRPEAPAPDLQTGEPDTFNKSDNGQFSGADESAPESSHERSDDD